MAEEDEKLNDTLEDVSKRLTEGNRNHVAEMSQMKKEINVMKEIAEAVLDIRQMMALSALADKRSGSLGTQEDASSDKGSLKTDDLEDVDTPKEVIAAIAGAITGLVAGIVSGIAGLVSSFLGRVSSMVIGEKNLAKITKSWKGLLTAISEFFVGVKNFLMKPFSKLSKSMKAAEAATKSSKLGKLFGAFSKYFKMMGATFQTAIAPAKMALKEISSMGKVFKSFFKFFKGFGKVLGRFFAPIMIAFDAITDIFRIFSDDTTSLKDKLIDSLAAIPKAIGNFFIEIPEMVKKGISWLFEKLLGPENPITKFLDSFSFTEMWSSAVESVTKFFKEFNLEPITNFFKESGEWVKDKFTGAMNGISSVWTTVKDSASAVFDNVKGVFSGIGKVFTTAKDWITETWETVAPVLERVWHTVTAPWRIFFKLIGLVFDDLKVVFTTAKDWVVETWNTFKPVIDAAWELVKIPFKAVGDAISGMFDGLKSIFTTAKDWMADQWVVVKQLISDGWELVKKPFTAIGNAITTMFDGVKSIFTGAKDWVVDNWDTIKEGLDTAWSLVKAPFESIFGGIKTIFLGMEKFFNDAEEGLDEGYESMKEKVIGLVMAPIDLLKKTIDYLKNLLSWENIKSSVTSMNPIPAIGSAIKNLVAGIAKAALEKFPALKYIPGFSKLAKGATETVENAISPPPAANQAVYADPSATISGLGQESVAMSDELVINKQQLDNTMSEGPLRSASNDGGVMAVDASQSNVTNVTNYMPSTQPSSRDNSDLQYLYRATGTTR